MQFRDYEPPVGGPHTVRGDTVVEADERVDQEVAQSAMLLSQGAERAIEMRGQAGHSENEASAIFIDTSVLVPSEFAELHAYPALRALLHEQVDMQFVDLYTLLRLPRHEHGLVGGGNLTAAILLCNIIAGASVLFYRASIDALRPQPDRGERFRGLVEEYYPWLSDEVLAAEDGAELLYTYTRNPLAHSLGVGKNRRPFPGFPGTGRSVMLSKARYGLADEEIRALVTREERPSDLPTISRDDDAWVISVETLTWGVYRMLHKLFADEEQVVVAEDTAERLLGRTFSPAPVDQASTEDRSWVRLVTEAQFDEYTRREGVIVNVDPATDPAEDGPKAHAWGCAYLSRDHFVSRFIDDDDEGGYFWAQDLETARRVFGARACRASQDPLNS